jgi:arylsulfatase A-like enzyme
MTNPPNILFISIDDLNDWVGVLGGYPGVKTPNIDRLATKGTLFSNAHTPVPVCNGARTAVLTGLQPSTTGVYSNFQNWLLNVPNAVTLPEYFRANGYQSIGAGKIFHRFQKEGIFDQYFDAEGEPDAPNVPGPVQFGPVDGTVEEMPDAKIANFAVEYLQSESSQPFFLSLGFAKPHFPISVPQEFFDLYPLDTIQKPDFPKNDLKDVPRIGQVLAEDSRQYQQIVELGYWEEIIQAYLAAISFVDRMVGRVLDSLYASPNADNTIVVLWSDNGWHLGEKLHWGKKVLWEEATHVPLIISAPDIADTGAVSTQAVSLLDLYPTLIELAGLSPKKGLEGESLVPLLKNPNSSRETPALSFWEHSYSVRTERWSYIRYYDGSEELYDRKKDPKEWHNLAGRPKYQQIKQDLAQWIPETKNQQLGTPSDDVLKGGNGQDVLIGEGGNDRIIGGKENDHLMGMDGNDSLQGGSGTDFLDGGQGSDLLKGNRGNDNLFGAEGHDRMKAGGGRDYLIGDLGDDLLKGGGGNDTLDGSVGDDSLLGNRGNDYLKGDTGNDRLVGGSGDDYLDAQGKNDILIGGEGNDTLAGAGGSDVFVFNSPKEGVDTIVDFLSSEDTISFSGNGFGSGLTPSSGTVELFTLGKRAKDSNDLFIYDRGTGSLFFDSDGSGSAEQVKIAFFADRPVVSAQDISIFT